MNQPKKALPNYFKILEGKLKPKFKTISLDKKIKTSFKILESCELCERKSKINRKEEIGWCKVGNEINISSIFPHYGEEYFLVPSQYSLIAVPLHANTVKIMIFHKD